MIIRMRSWKGKGKRVQGRMKAERTRENEELKGQRKSGQEE